MIVSTQSWRESGIGDVTLVGAVKAVAFYVNLDNIEEAIANLAKKYPDVDYVFNAKFTYTLQGHPSNDKVHHCYVTGDAYKRE
jgi:hypothetical protein